MEELRVFFENIFQIDLIHVVFSGARRAVDGQDIVKIKVRPVELKGEPYFQFESFTKTQAFHANLDAERAVERACLLMQNFKQAQVVTGQEECVVLVSKKGKASIRKKRREAAGQGTTSGQMSSELDNRPRAHNKEKNYILREGTAIPFLVDLGVMTKEGTIVRSKSDKFRQINRFLEFVEDVLPHLAKDREVTILDFGCGKSYLTFAMYYYLD